MNNISQKIIDKNKIYRSKNMRCKYNWSIIEPYLDTIINNGSCTRKRRFITLREFKLNIENGISCNKMKKNGICSSLVVFLSRFCQNKIKLEKKDFLNCYNNGMSLNKISEKYNIHRFHIRFLRQLYNIKRQGASFIKRKKTEIPLNSKQKEIIYGSMMGDASSKNIKYNSIVRFQHSNKQKKYLFWKYNEFKNIISKIYPKFNYRQDIRQEYKNSCGYWYFETKANTDIKNCLSEFYKNGKKEISNKILKMLSPLSIAVWFMDDGYTVWNHNIKNITNAVFCTDSFSIKSCEKIVKWFMLKHNIKSFLRERGLNKNGIMMYRIVIRSYSIPFFISLIKSYIITSMKYKINYQEYIKKRSLEKNGKITKLLF